MHPGKGENSDLFNPGQDQGTAALHHRGAGGVDIVDQTDRPAPNRFHLGYEEGGAKVFPSQDTVEGRLGGGIPRSPEEIGTDIIEAFREKKAGQADRLIEPAFLQPPTMQGDREDEIGAGEDGHMRCPDNFGQSRQYRGIPVVFQTVQEHRRRLIVAYTGHRPRIGRRMAQAGPAKLPPTWFACHLPSTASAEGRPKVGNPSETVPAEALLLCRQAFAAEKAVRRKEQIEARLSP